MVAQTAAPVVVVADRIQNVERHIMKLVKYIAPIAILVLVYFWNHATWSEGEVDKTTKQGDSVVVALESYKEVEGNYPPSLSRLTPTYIAEIPQPTVGSEAWEYLIEGDGFYLGVNGDDVDSDPVLYRTHETNEWFMDTR